MIFSNILSTLFTFINIVLFPTKVPFCNFPPSIESITSFGMFVELENTVEGLIRFDDLGSDEYFIYDEDRKVLIGEHTKTTYKIGDKVTIRVKNSSKLFRQIDFEIFNEKVESEKNEYVN